MIILKIFFYIIIIIITQRHDSEFGLRHPRQSAHCRVCNIDSEPEPLRLSRRRQGSEFAKAQIQEAPRKYVWLCMAQSTSKKLVRLHLMQDLTPYKVKQTNNKQTNWIIVLILVRYFYVLGKSLISREVIWHADCSPTAWKMKKVTRAR